jgi:hypothetical protein
MITRAQMPRQLRNRGGMTVKTVRQKYGLGSLVKKTIRKLIPNELADVAVKAAPFVAPFNPGAAALMRGVGRFDQRGSVSDALKQGAATFAFGKVAGKLGGAETGEGFLGGQKFTMEGFREGPIGSLFPKTTTTTGFERSPELASVKGTTPVTKEGTGIVRAITDKTIAKIPGVKKLLPKSVMDQLVVGGITSGASALYSYFSGDFRPQEEGETMEEYLAARKASVGKQMRTFMDNYYRFDPEYSAMSDAERDAFVARYNMNQGGMASKAEGILSFEEYFQGKQKFMREQSLEDMIREYEDYLERMSMKRDMVAKGGRVGLQEGGLPTVESLGGVPNTEGGSIVYDLGNGSYIYQSPLGFEIVNPQGVYTSLGTKDFYSSLDDLLDSGTVMRRADDPVLLARQAESARIAELVKQQDAPTIAAPTTAAPTTAAPTPTGVQTIPNEKFAVNVMMDEKGNVARDQGIPKLIRKTGTASNITGNVPIRSMSDVYRLAGITGEDSISMGTDYGDSRTLPSGGIANTLPAITGERLLRENVAINEERRRRNQELLGAAKARLPKMKKGGMMDIPVRTNSEGVRELDYRKTGGFVPIGVKEKADDVPAMLSKNEFVFTADAVRGAGNGSIKKGAQRMYDTMKKLESRVV